MDVEEREIFFSLIQQLFEDWIDIIIMDQESELKMRQFTIKLESQFIPTPTMVKQKLGLGYKVLAVELERESSRQITDIDSAVDVIVNTGYRALARAYHPDFGGDANIMVILNQAKKELADLLKMVRSQ